MPPDYVFADEMAEHAAWARDWYAAHGRPWLCAGTVAEFTVADPVVRLGGRSLTSRELARRFHAAHGAVVVAASAGPEAEAEAARCWANDSEDRYFFMEAYAAAVVEALIAEARSRLCAWTAERGEVLLPHYSPGYPGWSVADQASVFALLTAKGAMPGPLEVMASGMLQPKKSQLAVFAVAPAGTPGAATADLVPCRYCALARCSLRREPFQG